MNFKKNFFLFIFSVFLTFFFIGAYGAQAITVSPVIVDEELAPGMSKTGDLMIINDTGKDVVFYSVIQSFVPKGEEGDQKYLAETDVAGLPSWIHLETNKVALTKGETRHIKYKIDIPPNAEPGGHYATVFFSTSPPNLKDVAIGIASKTGILFLIRVSGDVVEKANIESFRSNQNLFTHLPAMLSLRIKNTGNVHIRPIGTLEVRNMWGGVVARVQANPRKSAVLPNSIRRLDTWWIKSDDIDKNSGFIAELKNEWRNFALGRYTARVNVKYGKANIPLPEQEVSFWVFPWAIILVLVVILILLLSGMKIYNKLIVSKALKSGSSLKNKSKNK